MNSRTEWALALFRKSVIKQQKWAALRWATGPTQGLSCLDIGSDNGVISHLFRTAGGQWKSADLDAGAVEAIRGVVETDVYQIDGEHTPFKDNEFDKVVIVDFLEHIPTEREFVNELHRIIKPGGELVVNVPHPKETLLRKFRLAIGQTDEAHGHLRHGYTQADLKKVLEPSFTLVKFRTYSKFFSETIDTFITWATTRKKKAHAAGMGTKGSPIRDPQDPERQPLDKMSKGNIVTADEVAAARKLFRIYSFLYPAFKIWAALDALLVGVSGYKLIARAKINKPALLKEAPATKAEAVNV